MAINSSIAGTSAAPKVSNVALGEQRNCATETRRKRERAGRHTQQWRHGAVMQGLAPTTGSEVYEVWAIVGSQAPAPIGSFEVGADGWGGSWLRARPGNCSRPCCAARYCVLCVRQAGLRRSSSPSMNGSATRPFRITTRKLPDSVSKTQRD